MISCLHSPLQLTSLCTVSLASWYSHSIPPSPKITYRPLFPHAGLPPRYQKNMAPSHSHILTHPSYPINQIYTGPITSLFIINLAPKNIVLRSITDKSALAHSQPRLVELPHQVLRQIVTLSTQPSPIDQLFLGNFCKHLTRFLYGRAHNSFDCPRSPARFLLIVRHLAVRSDARCEYGPRQHHRVERLLRLWPLLASDMSMRLRMR